MDETKTTYTKNDKMCCASYVNICEWVKKAWDKICEKLSKKLLKKAKIVYETDYD